MTAENSGGACDILVYGYIGDAGWWEDPAEYTTQSQFIQCIENCAKEYDTINVRINSCGGSPYHSDGMTAVMRKYRDKIHCWIDGLAASAAADLFLAAKTENRHVTAKSKLMLHCTGGICVGSASEMREMADTLDIFDNSCVAEIAQNTGKTPEYIKATYFDGEDHYLTADMMLSEGFVTTIENFDTSAMMPDNVENMSSQDVTRFYMEMQNIGAPNKENPLAAMARKAKDFLSRFDKKADAATTETIINEPKIQNDMTFEDLLREAQEGKLTPDQIAQLKSVTAEVERKAPVTSETLTSVVDELKREIETLKAQSGGKGAPTVASEDPKIIIDGTDDPDLKAIMELDRQVKVAIGAN